eukprot:1158483-Pelagomonas_calceolata.AAC.15
MKVTQIRAVGHLKWGYGGEKEGSSNSKLSMCPITGSFQALEPLGIDPKLESCLLQGTRVRSTTEIGDC